MNPVLRSILDKVPNIDHLTAEEKEAFIKAIKDSDKNQTMLQFKLERIEKDKHTLEVMLEESIEDLQKKSRAIEAQNRELEIESALERVRSVAMGMKKREDMLQVCKVISMQLEFLKVKDVRNVQTAIFYETKGIYVNYEFYARHDKELITEVEYNNHPVAQNFAEQMLKGPNQVWIYSFNGQEVKDWLSYQKSTNVFIDTYLENADTLNYYWYSLGPVAIGMSAYSPLHEEEIELFKRFRNVFELAYRRYLDIEKAEAQVREAEIQLALERIRAKSLAMHHTSELQDVVNIVAQQLLNISIDVSGGVFIAINNEVDKDIPLWASAGATHYLQKVIVPFLNKPVLSRLREAIKKRNNFLVEEYSQEEKIEFFQHLFRFAPWMETPEHRKHELLSREGGYTRSVAISQHTSIAMINHNGKKFTSADNQILERFGNVLEQSYVRFLDLQKAEAQTRESQIELGLERVRARAMAMQRSDELNELVRTVSEELGKLDFALDRSIISIIDQQTLGQTWWMSHPESPSPVGLFLKYHEHKPYLAGLNAWRERQLKFQYILEGEIKKEWDKFLFVETELSQLPGIVIANMRSKEKVYLSCSFNNFGYLSVATLEPLSNDQFDILLRFAKVFDLTYTRFNDLKQAEAQARESQIQLALERVRARTMAMQKSEELMEAANLLFLQVKSLGIPVWSCGYNIWEKGEKVCTGWMSTQGAVQPSFRIPLTEHRTFIHMNESRLKAEPFYVEELKGEELADHYGYMFSLPDFKEIATKQLQNGFPLPLSQINHVFNFKHGNLIFLSAEAIPEALDIFKRFTAVFEQTYTRFLDLQKAEAQAREGQIQLALERVRARTMAMQKSDELADVAKLLFKQVNDLGIKTWTTGFNVWSDDNNSYTDYITDPQGEFMPPYTIDATKLPVATEISNAKKRGDEFRVNYEEGEELKETYRQLTKFGEKQFQSILDSGFEFPSHQYEHFVFGARVSLMFITYDPVPEAHDIFKRFGKVFEQTYTRFLDLQKAEEQAREAQIETALEKVRSRSLAMHKSDELQEVVHTVFERLRELNVQLYTAIIIVFKEDSKDILWWMQNKVNQQYSKVFIKYAKIPYLEDLFEAKESGKELFSKCYVGKEKYQLYSYLFEHTDLKNVAENQKKFLLENEFASISIAFAKNTAIHLTSYSERSFTDEDTEILKRFAKVFDQAYTRFLDLQKAEAQAKEAQIEAALEKVRSRSLAVHKSDEFGEVVTIVFEKLQELKLPAYSASINIKIDGSKDLKAYGCGVGDTGLTTLTYRLPYFDHPVLNDLLHAHETGIDQFRRTYSLEEKNSFYEYEFIHSGLKNLPPDVKRRIFESSDYTITAAFGKKSMILINDFDSKGLDEKQFDILNRFSRVFEQAYTRFLDLQKAEAQAREAQIEAALERVRSKAMAMHKADDLTPAVAIVFEELDKLNLGMLRCGIGILHKEKRNVDVWSTSVSDEKTTMQITGDEFIDIHPLLQGAFDAWLNQTDFSYTLQGEDLLRYYKAVGTTNIRLPQSQTEIPTQYYYVVSFGAGGLFAFRESEFPEEGKAVMKRFANVFNLTYKRFLDLQKAEAQGREAQIEAALERVRSRTLAMQRSDELAETASVLFRQLIALGIEPNRLYINIVKDETGEAEFWITDEDGSTISMAYSANMTTNPTFNKMYDGWKTQSKSLIIDMHGKELQEYFRFLSDLNVPFKGGLSQKRRLQYIAYFSKGFIGMASPDEQPTETMQLLERFAAVFNLTFTRFNDLKIAEAHAQQAEQDLIEIKAAKKRAEDTLTELQATQRQLIQSEKMASLGELTAGIAHEIQNPLNFVNNFSDVSSELLEEMKTELERGNTKDAVAIVDDVKQNLEKILYHGKRADAIVKGMLQHSRTSSSQKELTDINALADEYLRLAYHGLRAKDKSFNAKFNTDFDKNAGKVNIIPQEIGRVILNLINNAFYAVGERQRAGGKRRMAEPEGLHPMPSTLQLDYEPTVTISTKKESDRIVITVADNGNGVPQKNLDKIFQPFFTTKPTGSGTGLGLSLAYDIVKTHAGQITVETKEGEGSMFIIQLPIN